MSEWLTTGEMIDRLKVGEVAESKESAGLRVKYSGIGFTYVNEEGVIDRDKGINGHFFINGYYIKSLKWRILPNYVSFDKAKEYVLNGGHATFHPEKGNPIRISKNHSIYGMYVQENAKIQELFEGKWTIEGEDE